MWHAKEPSLLNGHERRASVKICSPSTAIVSSPYKWKILEWNENPQTDKQNQIDLLSENFRLANNFWTVSVRALIFHKSIYFKKTFPVGRHIFYPVTLTLNLPTFKTLILQIIFERKMQDFSYFTRIFLMLRFVWLILNLLSLTFEIFLFKVKHYSWHTCTCNNNHSNFYIAHEHFWWQDLCNGIKAFFLVILAVFGIDHNREHLYFTNTSFCNVFHSLKIKSFHESQYANTSMHLHKKEMNHRVFLPFVA